MLYSNVDLQIFIDNFNIVKHAYVLPDIDLFPQIRLLSDYNRTKVL